MILKRTYTLNHLKKLMGILNLIILIYFSMVTVGTIKQVTEEYSARNFLNTITNLPMQPRKMIVWLFGAFFCLLGIMELRRRIQRDELSRVLGVAEFIVCLVILRCMYFGYNGIILLIIVDIAASIQDHRSQRMFLGVMIILYALADYNVISIGVKMISFQEFLNIYTVEQRMLLAGVKNILVSFNMVLFIVYIVFMMRDQMRERMKADILNEELKTANGQLQVMNEQLKDFAAMQKKMGEVEERNRIAREIHDTLGHTMTGLSAGIDACSALIDFSVEETKKQLQLLAKVARQGLQDIRRSMNKLRPDALEKHNLETALEKLMVETMDTSNVLIQYESTVEEMKFEEDEEDIIYRVVQESITNAIRHGAATKIYINFRTIENLLVIRIQDNGRGCTDIHKGFGLTHMKERVQMLQGTIHYDGSHGFQVHVQIPIRGKKK